MYFSLLKHILKIYVFIWFHWIRDFLKRYFVKYRRTHFIWSYVYFSYCRTKLQYFHHLYYTYELNLLCCRILQTEVHEKSAASNNFLLFSMRSISRNCYFTVFRYFSFSLRRIVCSENQHALKMNQN